MISNNKTFSLIGLIISIVLWSIAPLALFNGHKADFNWIAYLISWSGMIWLFYLEYKKHLHRFIFCRCKYDIMGKIPVHGYFVTKLDHDIIKSVENYVKNDMNRDDEKIVEVVPGKVYSYGHVKVEVISSTEISEFEYNTLKRLYIVVE